MEGVNIHNIEIVLKGDVNRDIVDIGALTLSADGREYMMDVIQSYSQGVDLTGDNTTRITCELEEKPDRDVFEDCKFDFTKEDLLDADCHEKMMTLYVGGDEDFEVESISLHFDIDGQDYQLKVIEEV
jgi:hypothetical protein